jgi:hypothetical protein
MPTPRAAIERRIAEVFAELPAGSVPTTFRAVGEADGVAWMLMLWPTTGPMPAIRSPITSGGCGPRSACRAAILDLFRTVGRPLKLTSVVHRLSDRFGESTVAKALAELMKSGELVNPRDRRGYRLPELVGGPPSLFE